MSIFSTQENTQAFLKMGILGFAGSGKTTTATNIAAGLTLYCNKKGITDNNKIFFLDTETGSDFVEKKFKENNLQLLKAKTRSFVDLIGAVKEAEKEANVLIIDSITHFWKELIEAYMKKKKRRYISMPDWGILKKEWQQYTDLFVNSNLHIIMCGRAGYKYNHIAGDNGRKELSKCGVKMKAENETGYESSLLVCMTRKQTLENDEVTKQWREAFIWKDRTDTIDGHVIVNPRFNDFIPHISCLNLGAKQFGVDTTSNSECMFSNVDESRFALHEQKKILLEELANKIGVTYSSSKPDKSLKEKVLIDIFGSSSWTAISNLHFNDLKEKIDKFNVFILQGEMPVKEEFPDIPDIPTISAETIKDKSDLWRKATKKEEVKKVVVEEIPEEDLMPQQLAMKKMKEVLK